MVYFVYHAISEINLGSFSRTVNYLSVQAFPLREGEAVYVERNKDRKKKKKNVSNYVTGYMTTLAC